MTNRPQLRLFDGTDESEERATHTMHQEHPYESAEIQGAYRRGILAALAGIGIIVGYSVWKETQHHKPDQETHRTLQSAQSDDYPIRR